MHMCTFFVTHCIVVHSVVYATGVNFKTQIFKRKRMVLAMTCDRFMGTLVILPNTQEMFQIRSIDSAINGK